ncbi:MAG: hypothetical protein V3U11_04305, partial [Planctomycetota bacterium]
SYLLPIGVMLAAAGAVAIADGLGVWHRQRHGLVAGLAVGTNLLALAFSPYPAEAPRYIGYYAAAAAADHLAEQIGPAVVVIASQFDLVPVSYYVFRKTGRFERYRMIKLSSKDVDLVVLRTREPRPQVAYVIENDQRPVVTAAGDALGRLGYTRVATRLLPGSRILRYETER